MATVKEPRGVEGGWAETDRRVRHPLQAVRKYIRGYVMLEGLGVAVLYLAGMLWLGLLIDWGLFTLFAFDWIQELQYITAGQGTDFWLRLALLGIFVGGLVAVVAVKVVYRLMREFSDTSVALLLERRFPRELGDRLITAVELADPSLAEKYGFSPSMVDRTIREAAERVEKLPVTDVFNWSRLRKLFVLGGLLTVGVYVALAIVFCLAGAVTEGSTSPVDFMWRFNDAASIFGERNLLLMDTYWPRNAYLEVIGFQDTPQHPNEMRVGRDEQRPDLQVRAVRWVVADHAVQGGWRPLRWSDLGNLLDATALDKIDMPANYPGWVIDLDDLDASIPAGIVPGSWQGKTSGAIRADLDQHRRHLEDAKATKAVDDLLDWRTWTFDRLQLQVAKSSATLRQEHVNAVFALEKIATRLQELAETSSMSRRLRYLDVPETVTVYYRGKTVKNDQPCQALSDNKFMIGLADLKESVRFTVRGDDFYTAYKHITLVPPPTVTGLTVDKEEPAYTHYRLQGDQAPLKGLKQIFKGHIISVTGEVSIVPVPLGTNLVIVAEVEKDRALKDGVRVTAPEKFTETGALVPDARVVLDESRQKFSLQIDNVAKTYEFWFDFLDQDNVKGRRRVLVRPLDDRPPEIFDVELEYVPRKPRFKQEPGKGGPGTIADSYLITPDAIIPIKGTVQDDYGLTRVDWAFEAEQIDVELMGDPPSADKGRPSVFRGNPVKRRAGWVASGLQFSPVDPGMPAVLPAYWSWLSRMVRVDLALKNQSDGEKTALLKIFKDREAAAEAFRFEDVKARLTQKPGAHKPFNKIAWKDDMERFDLKEHLPQLKSSDPQSQAQLHYQLKLALTATDNNVETGPGSSRTKTTFQFLVVSENELLAQIGIEEEVLSERLEKVYEKLKTAKTTLNDQHGKLSQASPQYQDIAIRVDEVRKALMDGGTITREVHADFSRIKRELEVNQIKAKKEIVENQIVAPLGLLIDSKDGDFPLLDVFVLELHESLESDAQTVAKAGNAEVSREERLKTTRAAHNKVDQLMNKLNDILVIMQQEVTYAKALEAAIRNERVQREIALRLQRLYADREREELELLLNPPKK